MDDFEKTHDVLSAELTPHQTSVLRRRFGLKEAEVNESDNSATLPPPSDEDDGSGGSAPASPQLN